MRPHRNQTLPPKLLPGGAKKWLGTNARPNRAGEILAGEIQEEEIQEEEIAIPVAAIRNAPGVRAGALAGEAVRTGPLKKTSPPRKAPELYPAKSEKLASRAKIVPRVHGGDAAEVGVDEAAKVKRRAKVKSAPGAKKQVAKN